MPPRASTLTHNSFNAAQLAVAPLSPLPPPAKKPREGISSILGSDSDHRAPSAPAAASIRRTLSADMSSKNWLSHNGFSAAADDHRPGQDEVWSAIQTQKITQPNNDAIKPPAALIRSSESFSSIVLATSFQTTEDPFSASLIPAVEKKPPKKLSLQSLQICTEILCSETGADDFSPDFPLIYPEDTERRTPLKNRYSKRAPPKPFPPPLPSLNLDKTSVQILPRRQNGRLTLEAVSLPPQEYLRAERRDGRLLIVLVNGSNHHETEEDNKNNKETEEETEMVFNSFEEEEEEEEETDEPKKEEEEDDEEEEEKEEEKNIMEVLVEREINIPRRYPPLMMQFPGLICKKHPPWTINRAVAAGGEDDVIINQFQAHSLPPAPGVAGLIGDPPPAATSTTFVNAYDYFWRKKPAVAGKNGETEDLTGKKNRNDNKNEDCELGETKMKKKKTARTDSAVLLRGTKANNMVIPMLNNGCKDGRRWSSSLLLRDPHCIATT